MEDKWITDAIKKFQGLNELFNYMERRHLAEGLFRKDQDGTYYEKVMVIQTAKAGFERSRILDRHSNPIIWEKPNFLHPFGQAAQKRFDF